MGMKKMGLALCLALMFGAVHADELSVAQKLWDEKNFTAAFQAFSKLAQAGNPVAQQQLGEMYGFGEGTPEDMAQATQWLQKAAQAGNKEAPGSLELVRRRAAHKADIQLYVQQFDGADARYEKFACASPNVPAKSTTNEEIKVVNAAVQVWTECYGRFATNLNAKAQVTNTIPANVVDLMNNDEFARASAHIGAVYSRIAAQGQQSSDEITRSVAAWMKATEQYVADTNNTRKAELARLQATNDQDAKANAEMVQSRAAKNRGGSR
jgi:hypothetical protein